MAHKSGLETVGNLAHLAKALYDIIKAFMQGGWAAAALQALKHYWPQILAVALVLLLLPVIIFCCLPMIMFGYESSTDTKISSITVEAQTVSGYYDNYESYIDEWVENIKSTVIDGEGKNTETDGTTAETEDTEDTKYEVMISGSKIQKNRFIALHSVSVENNLDAVDEVGVKSFSEMCVSYTVKPMVENTESDAESDETTDGGETTDKMLLDIHYRTPEEIMEVVGFSDSDKNWYELILKSLEGGANT